MVISSSIYLQQKLIEKHINILKLPSMQVQLFVGIHTQIIICINLISFMVLSTTTTQTHLFPHLQRVLNKTLMLPYVDYIVLILVLLRHHLFRNISRHVSHEFKIFMYTQSTATTFEMVCLCQKSCYQIVATSCLMILKVQQ